MSDTLLARLMSRIKNLVGTGTVTGAETQWLQIKTATGRTNDRIRRVHNYGFMSRPLVGAKTYNLFIGGVTARGITVSVEDERYQMALQPGEVAMLDDKGNLVHFTADGIKVNTKAKLDITAAGDVSVTAPKVDVTAPKFRSPAMWTSAATSTSRAALAAAPASLRALQWKPTLTTIWTTTTNALLTGQTNHELFPFKCGHGTDEL